MELQFLPPKLDMMMLGCPCGCPSPWPSLCSPLTLRASPCVSWFWGPIFWMRVCGHELGSEDKPQNNTWINLNVWGEEAHYFYLKINSEYCVSQKAKICMNYWT